MGGSLWAISAGSIVCSNREDGFEFWFGNLCEWWYIHQCRERKGLGGRREGMQEMGCRRAEGPGVRGHLGSDGQLGMYVALRRARLAVDTCFRN